MSSINISVGKGPTHNLLLYFSNTEAHIILIKITYYYNESFN